MILHRFRLRENASGTCGTCAAAPVSGMNLKRVNWSKRFDSIAFTSCTMTDYKNMKCISEGGVFEALPSFSEAKIQDTV
jgi:predicted metal-binding protein